jgi:hypothetical protein
MGSRPGQHGKCSRCAVLRGRGQLEEPKEVNDMAITITKVEKIEATRMHTDPSQLA